MLHTDRTLTGDLQDKLQKLEDIILDLGSVAIAFSGGVDSALLLFVAHELLGDKAVAVTAKDAAMPGRELAEAKEFCSGHNIRHIVCDVDPLGIAEYRNNSVDRCYHCKHMVFSTIRKAAAENGLAYVAEGSNTDDAGDYRPGLRAIAELGIKSPLKDAGLCKQDIRTLSEAFMLPVWNKPSYACLASRFVYGEEITVEKLRMVDEAEQFLIDKGFRNERVRMHGDLARIEVQPDDIPKLVSDGIREEVFDRFRQIGFLYVTIDLKGYRTGSMNETLKL
ncbi:MAG: ATP-dependent sacrificial sulfur transferase LarE [Lachnospiraceae bacterium]|nr:ATP-dependent sacrificial sulfur transferase LarE [Lachnospiraceae bacterium]